MKKQAIPGGTVHALPADLRKALLADDSALERWRDLTPLARNEWICWTINVKLKQKRINNKNRKLTDFL
jgi:hypothetical protein